MTQSFIEQSPKIIAVYTDPEGLTVQIALAVVTGMAVLIALFQEKIKDFLNQVRLKLEINLQPPDCHQIDLSNNGQFVSKSIYLRIRVQNTSNSKTAMAVEVLMANLWKVQRSGGKNTIVRTFLPMNLRWSHDHPTSTTILPRSFKFCDLGPVRPFGDGVILKLDTITQPNPVSNGKYPNVIEPGSYLFELIISGDNVVPEKSYWNLSVPNKWSDNEKVMLKRIKITKG